MSWLSWDREPISPPMDEPLDIDLVTVSGMQDRASAREAMILLVRERRLVALQRRVMMKLARLEFADRTVIIAGWDWLDQAVGKGDVASSDADRRQRRRQLVVEALERRHEDILAAFRRLQERGS